MTRYTAAAALALALAGAAIAGVRAETKREYEARFVAMMEISERIDDLARQHLEDRALLEYAHTMAAANAAAAEQMTPSKEYAMLHPHFLLVLENIERSLFYAADGKMERYRHFQKQVRKELQLLEELADRAGLDLYRLGRGC
jgi:hypothetical protein